MLLGEKEQGTTDFGCVLRVLDGPLCGCEYELRDKQNLFVVGMEREFFNDESAVSFPEHSFYIPLEGSSSNFEVLVEETAQSGVMVRIFGEEVVERSLTYQVIHSVGSLRIALRPLDADWVDGLFDEPAPETFARTISNRLSVKSVIAMLLSGVVLIACFWWESRPTPVVSVKSVVGGVSSPYRIIKGRDDKIYMFASSERELSWGRQVMMRNNSTGIDVMSIREEAKRVEGELLRHYPGLAFHRLDLSNPEFPRLVLSKERAHLDLAAGEALRTFLLKDMPYVQSVKIERRSDLELEALAKDGLQRLAVPFERMHHPAGVTFKVRGALNDGELNNVRELVESFYQQWGGRYVSFALELDDDWLKGKSYQLGSQGYIKMSPSSWYFPAPT
ncbi:hypothetical protein C4J93_2170 [Pseudomonas sp. R2-37-08W]|uniref:PrgH/EprH family type III secretion apparatus protein n=1 Tax=unclassified Pseudomonas TaxID=196821 RepID=UPI000F6F049F|nr:MULTISPECIES: PrgH/EprH family type III secretion apparatus protein [unclassified Pseudomonas]AZF10368.1 hypothetical protein C4J93_2170 [Pseudomonas sp. R2-37-08W]MDQ0741099.1 type III secretion system PrgH/EprH family protein [Pseudomonas sp. W4I3]